MAFNFAALIQKNSADPDRVWTTADWVQAVAAEWAARSNHGWKTVPAQWLVRLGHSFWKIGIKPRPLPVSFLKKLQPEFWDDPSLLGECLQAARLVELESQKERSKSNNSRAGRVSTGVVYTPASVAKEIIADIFRNGGKDENSRIVDPACGAGVFLLEAFLQSFQQRVLSPCDKQEAAAQALSLDIGGVDIDEEALAVAEFSLRLLAFRMSGLDWDVPLLLRCTDALKLLPEYENRCRYIVGNPPYLEGRSLSQSTLKILRKRFFCARDGKVNLFAVFVERALELACENGQIALVIPATFLRNERYFNLRELLLAHTIEAILPLDARLFDNCVVETVILQVRKCAPTLSSQVQVSSVTLQQRQLAVGHVKRFCVDISQAARTQVDVMDRLGVPLEDYFEVRDGISTGYQPFPLRLLGRIETYEEYQFSFMAESKTEAVSASQPDAMLRQIFIADDGSRVPFDPQKHHRVIDGCEFNCFTPVNWAGRYIEHDKRHEHHPPHPGRIFNCQLRDAEIYDRAEKIITRQTALGLIATVDRQRYFVRNSVHVTYVKEPYLERGFSLDALCAAMNSEFYKRYLLAMTGETGASFPQVHIADIRRLPILPELLKSTSGTSEETLAGLGRKLLDLHAEPVLRRDEIIATKAAVEALLSAAFGLLLMG